MCWIALGWKAHRWVNTVVPVGLDGSKPKVKKIGLDSLEANNLAGSLGLYAHRLVKTTGLESP